MALGVLRAGIGAVTLVVPSLARLWVGPVGASGPGKVMSRSLAARDLSIGIATIMCRNDPRQLRKWAAAGAFSDTTDALGTAMAFSGVPRRVRLAVTATSATAAALGAIGARYLTVSQPLASA